MAHLRIQAFVQFWSKGTGMSKLKEAMIETTERQRELHLKIFFHSGDIRILRLNNNITSVVVRHCGQEVYLMCVTFEDNTSLFVDKLPYIDALKLKNLFDSFLQNRFQLPMKRKRDWDVLDSRREQEVINQPLFSDAYYKPLGYGSFNTKKEARTPSSQTFSSVSKSSSNLVQTKRIENPDSKKEIMVPSHLVNKDHVQENNSGKKIKKHHSEQKEKIDQSFSLHSQKEPRDLISGLSFNTSSTGQPNLDKSVPPKQTLSDRESKDLPLDSKCSQKNPRHDEVQSPMDSHPKILQVGFPNLGNTCYMNSILQSLFAIPTFADDLLRQGIPWQQFSSNDLIMPFSQLLMFKDICQLEIKQELLLSIKNRVSAMAEIFSGNMQNDAHEFLAQCLNQLKGDMEILNPNQNAQKEVEGDNSSPQICTGPAATRTFVCPIVANFEMELQISIMCKTCEQTTVKKEVSNYLSINLRQDHPWSIQNSFDLFFQPEQIERRCEACQENKSVLVPKFSRIPRILIIHLKRYCFTDNWLLVKNNQQVQISKYLSLSSHCYENVKPPPPLTSNGSVGDDAIPKGSGETIPETFDSSIPFGKSTSKSKDSGVLCVGSQDHVRLPNIQKMCEGASEEQHDRGLNTNSKLVDTKNRTLGGKTSPVPDSTMATVEPSKDRSQDTAGQRSQNSGERNHEELLQQAPAPCLRKLDILEESDTKLSSSSEMRFQKNDQNLCSSRHPENKDISEGKNTIIEINKPKSMKIGGEHSQMYRLISVVNHMGSTYHSGHYVSDIYDFQKHQWFTYSDLKVSEIPEDLMQEARLRAGYIFFYMHNEIFEELLKKAETDAKLAKEKLIPEGAERREDLFSELLQSLAFDVLKEERNTAHE